MEYFELKKQIEFLELQIKKYAIKIDEYKNPNQEIINQITQGNSGKRVVSLPKSNPNELAMPFLVRKYFANGDFAGKSKVMASLRMISKNKNNKHYEIIEITDTRDFFDFSESQVAEAEMGIKTLREQKKKFVLQAAKMKNPREDAYAEILFCLRESLKSAISKPHKEEIERQIDNILSGNETYMSQIKAAWYAGAKQFVSKLILKIGGKKIHKSGKDVRGSVYYMLPNKEEVRISDHQLPMTERRRENQSRGVGVWELDFVLEMKSFSKLKKEILTDILDNFDWDSPQKNTWKKESDSLKAIIEGELQKIL
jgi:hypothetical protein